MPTIDPRLEKIAEKFSWHPEFLGLDITHANQAGAVDDTLLHLTARIGELDDLRTLVACGADVNAVGDMGFTPLHSAALTGCVDSFLLLLELGADPSRLNAWNQSPVDTARAGGNAAVVEAFANYVKR